ncbi:unnamed protein product [Rotaria sp. Silwood1]|nr:unnamed protein product [Rotaria sp. Silwood1]CAF1249258.1 unnamed protein product [Rotaria sp. Silwood1]CAF1256942.1 unnamed protein product [Rotaria sp. Silwood1]CAF3500315.1 unnamed protein product [Rotaria sp. Silwood1]CAF3509307.1 unnamed protein product [Rotaria sp. Silwood1]
MPLLKSAQRRLNTQREIINHFSQLLPSFNDLFDERSCRFVTLADVDYDYKNRNRRTGRFPGVKRTRLL